MTKKLDETLKEKIGDLPSRACYWKQPQRTKDCSVCTRRNLVHLNHQCQWCNEELCMSLLHHLIWPLLWMLIPDHTIVDLQNIVLKFEMNIYWYDVILSLCRPHNIVFILLETTHYDISNIRNSSTLLNGFPNLLPCKSLRRMRYC